MINALDDSFREIILSPLRGEATPPSVIRENSTGQNMIQGGDGFLRPRRYGYFHSRVTPRRDPIVEI